MPTVSIDHIAMPTANAERLDRVLQAAWDSPSTMKRSGGQASCQHFLHSDWRLQDKRPSLRDTSRACGGHRLFPVAEIFAFVWDGTVEECQEWLAAAGVEVIQGPVPRKGGRGFGKVPSLSLYARDPGRQSPGVDDLHLIRV